MLRRLLLSMCLVMCAGPVVAQSSADAQLRQLRLQVRQAMQAARDAQQTADAAKADAEAARARQAELQAALDEALGRRDAAAASASRLRQDKGTLEGKLTTVESALTETRELLAAVRTELNTQVAGRRTAEAGLRDIDAALATCRAHNGELVGVADELLTAYQHKGVFDILGEGEPFTGIGRVRLENLLGPIATRWMQPRSAWRSRPRRGADHASVVGRARRAAQEKCPAYAGHFCLRVVCGDQLVTTGILPILACHSFGPVL